MTKELNPKARNALYKAVQKDKFNKSIEYLGICYSFFGPHNRWVISSMREIHKTYNGAFFFRKYYPSKKEYLDQLARRKEYISFFFPWDIMHKRKKTEHMIVKQLQANPHKNIISIYDIKKNYIDLEILRPLPIGVSKHKKFISMMKKMKQHLHKLGIMYIDWKFNNIGVDKHGTYKLHDFDASGIIKKTNPTKWLLKPPYIRQYATSQAHNCRTPLEIDNCSFDMYIMGKKTCNCKIKF